MKIYNSKTNKLEKFKPLNENKINMYVCGPTLYSDIHIGNARPLIFFDVVHRYFKENGYDVKFVSNITDIDDKIIKKAQELNITEEVLIERNLLKYDEVIKKLNILKYYKQPKVTDYIEAIISYIEELIKNDYAYVKNQTVYFRVDKIKKYGEISNINLEFQKAGIRIEIDENKEYKYDFVLWKKTDTGITWQAPFGKGRPGWHTECVCMINEIFNQTIDIHGGGVDLKFPHHENENAQSNACNNELSNFWMHNGFINIDNEKMSKSIGNTMLTKDLLAKYGVNVVRLMMFQTNYRQPINIDKQFIKQTQKINKKFENIANQMNDKKYVNNKLIENARKNIENDFNLANVISLMLESTKSITNEKLDLFKYCFKILGLHYEQKDVEIPKEISELLKKREIEKGRKNYELADIIKVDILNLGYEVIDTRDGVICKKK